MDLGRGSISSLLRGLETGRITNAVPSLHGHTSFSRRMVLGSELEGHRGCVNRLALSDDGSLLLSGSDDCDLIVWSIESGRSVVKRGSVSPGHHANIFGVAFMPETGNRMVASAGLDSYVRYTHVETAQSTLWRYHTDMVKTVHPLDSHNFVTASKDGTARVTDVRQSPDVEPRVVAMISDESGRLVHMSSAVPSPVNSNHLLVAAGDAYMRVFDLRACPFSRNRIEPASSINNHCIEIYSPLHLHLSSLEPLSWRGLRNVQSTYANFSSDGRQIVASYFEDAVFVFDRWDQSNPTFCMPPFQSESRREKAMAQFGCQSASFVLSQKFENAATAAKHVLGIDENDMFALLCLAISLPKCNLPSDPRFAYGYFSKILGLLEKDRYYILSLWNCSEARFTEQEIESMADIWKIILEYLRLDQLLLLCPPLYQGQSNLDRHVHELTASRLDYLNRIFKDLISRCDQKLMPLEKSKETHVALITRIALGLPSSRGAMSTNRYCRMRADVLRSLVRKFSYGIVRIREKIKNLRELMVRRSGHRGVDYVIAHSEDSRSSDSELDGEPEEPVNFFPQFARSHRYTLQQIGNHPFSVDIRDSARGDDFELWGPLELQERCRRFHGHTSRETEIKEANFYGSNNQIVLSGSDDGRIYLWSSATGALLSSIDADDQIVNCVLGHPYHTMIFASGIDDSIKVLTPGTKVIPSLATYPSDLDDDF